MVYFFHTDHLFIFRNKLIILEVRQMHYFDKRHLGKGHKEKSEVKIETKR